jgi:HK97 family phage portal protein
MTDPFPMIAAAPDWSQDQAAGTIGDYRPNQGRMAELWGVNDSGYSTTVTERSALAITAFFCGVSLISEAMGMMPLQVWKKNTTDEGWTHQDQHPVNYCLSVSPNGWQTPSSIKSLIQAALILAGNGVCRIERNGRGQGVGIEFVPPPNVQYYIEADNSPSYGIRNYPIVNNSLILQLKGVRPAGYLAYDWDEVLHFKAFGTDSYSGLSTLNVARNSLSLTQNVESFGYKYYNKGRPAGFLTKKGIGLTDPQRETVRQEWETLYSGANQFSVGVLHGGWSWESLGYTNDDAQFLQTRQFQVLEIARLLRVPPHMLGEISKATNSNIETLMMDFITFTLLPWIIRWEEELNLKMFTPREQAMGFQCFFDVDVFLRGDSKTRATVEEMDIRNGTRTIEEVRLASRRNPYADGTGKKPLIIASQLDTLERVEAGTSLLQGTPAPAPTKEPANGK